MAQTYTHTPVLSKVKLGNTTYYLKDADVRTIMDTFGNVVTLDKAATITADGTGLVDAALVYDYVGRQVGNIGQALNLKSAADHTALENPQAGDFVVESSGAEWLYDGTEWREIGSENTYVVRTQTIAGIDLQDNITVGELQTALGLKALAYKDNGTVAIQTADSIGAISTGAAGTYSVTASEISVPATYNELDVTPAGSVSIEAGTAAAASYDKTTSVTVSSAAPAEGATANYTPTGSVTVTDVSITPSTASVAKVTNAGTAYAITEGSVTKGNDTTSTFAIEGMLASIDETDIEMLVLTPASTSNAVTVSGSVNYTAPVLTGALPTFGSENVVTGITSASATASFSGDGTVLSATPGFTATNATMTQPTFTGAFTGTSKNVTPSVRTTVKAAGTDGEVTVTAESITPTLNKTEKTVNVAFGVNA